MSTTTQVDLQGAFAKAMRRLHGHPAIVASESSAGFVFEPGHRAGRRVGYQVCVKVARYSDELLAKAPETGGLLENAQ